MKYLLKNKKNNNIAIIVKVSSWKEFLESNEINEYKIYCFKTKKFLYYTTYFLKKYYDFL